MIQVKEDKLVNFVKVLHKNSGEFYRLHIDDIPKVGTKEKVAVLAVDGQRYFAPSKEYPHGRYISKARYFIGEYLSISLHVSVTTSATASG